MFFVVLSMTVTEPSRLRAIIVVSVAKSADIDYLAIVIFCWTMRFSLQKRSWPLPVPIINFWLSLVMERGYP